MNATDIPSFWIGLNNLTDNENYGNFQWEDGTSVGWANWADGQPNTLDNNQHCVELVRFLDDLLNDQDCSHRFAFICQGRSLYI